MQHYDTTSFLGLPEFKVIPMIETDDYLYIRIEKNSIVETCPSCHSKSTKVHDRRKQPIKDLPIRGKSIMLVLIKRRFRCTCCNKVFGETYETIDRYQRITKRFIAHITKESIHSTFKAAANNNGVSCFKARSLFVNTAKQLTIDKHAPRVLAMDEFAVKKGKGDNKYNLAIAVPTERRLFDILPDRRQATVEAYLDSLLSKELVEVVAIDMWRPYKRAIEKALPNAVIVVDKFHVVRNVMWALDRVRRRIVEGDRELRKLLKRSRYLLLKNYNDLDIDGQKRLLELLEYSDELKQTYWLKEWFTGWYHDRHYATAAYQLDNWLQAAKQSNIKEMLYVVKTITHWKSEILNYFKHRITTGFLEGMNNKIKTIKRMAYGFRTPGILRAKVLLAR
jgi:transposase